MGVLNVTNDSFSDGGRYLDADDAVAHGLALAAEGAGIVDVGGESTRPGAVRIDPRVEASRVVPVVKELAGQGIIVSIDTMHADVARAALQSGARMVNDVSGGRADPAMAPLLAEAGVPWVLMHWRAVLSDRPHVAPHYHDVVAEVRTELLASVDDAVAAGVDPDKLVIDPGLGFAKTGQHNWALLHALPQLVATGIPVLLGASRKQFLGTLLAGPDDLFPRGAQEYRDPGGDQLRQRVQQGPIVLSRLGESKPGVDHQLGGIDTRGHRVVDAGEQLGAHLGHHVVVARGHVWAVRRHRSPVHQHPRHPGLG